METYNGHVRTPQDAILLFEACRIGLLPRVQRRLSEKERQQIKSGSVFVWDEREAGMRRWTDGKSWSASRVSGSFLTYREMEGKRGGSSFTPTPAPKRPSGKSPDGSSNGDSEGEGPDGYRYKPDGLMKQSFSITTSGGQHLHLISYFSRSNQGGVPQPSQDPQLRHIRPPKNMYPESSVNENTNVPAVTRGPMTSPYAPAPQQMGSQSPHAYPRPGHSPQVPVVFSPYPGPPTPPYQLAIYPPHPHFAAYQHPQFFYHPAPGYPHPQEHILNRAPPPPSNPNGPPPPGYPAPQHYQIPPQYAHPGPARPPHTLEYAQQQAPANGQKNAHQQPTSNGASLPEQGPVLPALNGIGKPPTPQPSESKSADALNADGASQNNAPSPGGRTIPNIHNLLQSHGADSSATAKVTQPGSRSGSRSPGHPQGPPQEMIAAANSSAADTNAISKLNRFF